MHPIMLEYLAEARRQEATHAAHARYGPTRLVLSSRTKAARRRPRFRNVARRRPVFQ